jgi:hypothetical protein
MKLFFVSYSVAVASQSGYKLSVGLIRVRVKGLVSERWSIMRIGFLPTLMYALVDNGFEITDNLSAEFLIVAEVIL